MAAALPWVTAGIGAVMGQDQNRRASRQQQEGLDMQKETLARKNELFDLLKGIVTGADAAGEFNPNTRIQMMNESSLAREGKVQEASAGASRILGYRPGDSVPISNMRGTSENFELNRRDQENQIRNEAFARRLGAYGSLNAPSEGIAVGQNLYNAGESQRSDLTGLFQSIMPFLNQQKQKTQRANPTFAGVTAPRFNGLDAFEDSDYLSLKGFGRR